MQINRLVFPGFWFGKTSEKDALALARAGVGGFCVYGGDKKSLKDLCEKLRQVSPLGKNLIIAADYEDGLGRWLKEYPLLPSNLALGAADDENFAFEKGYITARQALDLGVNWVFAPVVDLADNPKNPIVNTRSFGKDPHRVARLARAFMRGLAAGGALNSIKHFPGHGNTQTDSHLAMPLIADDLGTLEKNALAPFKTLLGESDSVMIGHLLVPCLDEKYPASLSEKIMQGLLAGQLNYQKCICTDALCMKALGDEKQAALRAFNSGAHILLAPEKPADLMAFLHTQPLDKTLLEQALKKQDELIARSIYLAQNVQKREYNVPDFCRRVAHKSLVKTGNFPPLQSGQQVAVLEIGNDEKIDRAPFFDTLSKEKIAYRAFDGESDFLLVLFWRRYQAFKGKISLNEQEEQQLARALKQAKNAVVVCFSTPWVTQGLGVKNQLCVFSPAPQFQQAAALALCGKFPCKGKLPVDL